jgi:hypothetical protein
MQTSNAGGPDLNTIGFLGSADKKGDPQDLL